LVPLKNKNEEVAILKGIKIKNQKALGILFLAFIRSLTKFGFIIKLKLIDW